MKDIYILGIESSCDDTSAAVLKNGVLLSNVTASQEVHKAYGGVVPELASRAHQQNVVPVVDQAIARAGIKKEDLSAVAFTRGPGLMGSLLVGVSFAKGFARSLNIPMIDVNHLQGHVMAHFIKESDDDQSAPPFPFICLLVSGGNSQIVKVNAYNDMEVLGQTIDDAAGEAIDKCAKVLEWGYPGGPVVDKYARQGNPKAFSFSEPHIPGLNYSFSGFKTSFLYSKRSDDDDDEGLDTDIESNVDDSIEKGKTAAKKGGKAETDADGYMAFKMPWSLTFGYGITMREDTRREKFNEKTMRYAYKFTQTLNMSGNVRISDGWNISFSSGYDFDNHKISMTTASLARDLHCFNMSCSVVLAPYTSYNFTFRCNAATLTDALKYDKRSGYSNAVQWY